MKNGKELLQKMRSTSWWWGCVLLTLVATALPYWLWGIFGGDYGWKALWRVPVAPNVIFDSYAYFQQIGLLKAGIQTGSFGWFAWPLSGLMRLLPFASIPEIWIVSRWVTTFLLMWVGAWCIRKITDVNEGISRWLIVCFWLSFLLVIGLRPGVFSWDLPFGFLGIGLMAMATDALRSNRWMKAIAYSIAILWIFTIYPWFLMYGLLFLVVLWVLRIIQVWPRLWPIAVAVAVFTVCGFVLFFAAGWISLRLPASFFLYERNGVMFSHMPLISNTVLACMVWLGLLFGGRSRWRASGLDRPMEFLSLCWIVLFIAWLSTPFVGIFLQSDHFVIIVAMLSWSTLALYVMSRTGVGHPVSARWERIASIAMAIFSSVFFLYIAQKGFRRMVNFETFTIHLSIWLSLAWSAWFHWFYLRGWNIDLLWRRLRWMLLVVCFFLGATGLGVVIHRGMKDMPDLRSRISTIDWMQANVPYDETVCSDPVNASIYGAHNARQTYPEESNIVLAESDDAQHRRLMTIGAAYDTSAAGDEGRYSKLINGLRRNTCDQYAKVARFMERLAVPRKTIDAFLGCLRERADAYDDRVMTAIKAKNVDAPAFRALCPWVVIPDDRRIYWNLPGSYEEIRVDDQVSIWHAK